MSNNLSPVPYRKWYDSDDSQSLKWIFSTKSSLAYFLRSKKDKLVAEGLIEVLPTRGYFIKPESFTEDSIKKYFVLGV
ncbi:hypothetical protein [Polynucleobacter sp. MWH-UH23A]|uniref:hypothetical protein n=1 Tax=Polynucleobacter sp. MWH-UH23A TaxID=1855613 RepID=UPI003364D0BE